MTKYVKVTVKEFEAMRTEIEAGWAGCGSYDDIDAINTVHKAVDAAKAIERRNNIPPSPYLTKEASKL